MVVAADDDLASLLRQRAADDPHGQCLVRGSERWTNAQFLHTCTALGRHVVTGRLDTGVLGVSAASSRYVPFLVWASILTRVDLLLMTGYRSADSVAAAIGPLPVQKVFCDLAVPEHQCGLSSLESVARLCEAARVTYTTDSVEQAEDSSLRRGGVRPAAFLFQTSGTEGEPKLVRCEHRAFAKVVRAMLADGALDHAVGANAFLSQPLVHSYGLSSYFEYLAAGAVVVLPPERSALGPAGDLMTAGLEVNAIEGVPYFWSQFSKLQDKLHVPSLRHLGIGGGPLDPHVMGAIISRVPHATMSVRYGLTETPSVVTHKTFHPPHDASRWHSSGRPISAYTLTVRGDQGDPLAVGREGEIVVTSDCVSEVSGVLATGDAGYVDDQGELVVTGRRSAFIKRRGYRLSPDAIEAAVRECEGIADCRAVGLDDRLVLEVVYTSEAAEQGMLARLRARLPDAMVPDTLTRVDAIQRTFSGKIRRR